MMRCRDQLCRDADVHRWVQRCTGAQVQKWRGAVVQMCRGGAEMTITARCRDDKILT